MGMIFSKGQAIVWGYLAQDAKFRSFESGKSVANFSIRYGAEPGEAQGRKKGLFMDVDAWNQLSLYAANFEKGDSVVVFGHTVKDEYKSSKQGKDVFKLMADIALVQPVAGEAEPEYAPDAAEAGNESAAPGQGMEELGDNDGGELPF